MKYFLAIDLGATSGRHIISYKENNEIKLVEIYRFLTGMKESKDGLVWDIPQLTKDILEGIKIAFQKYPKIESLSIDTWGVDYVLMNNDKEIPPFYAYRNARLNSAVNNVHKIIPFSTLYEHTGIQFANFNTIYQLFDDLQKGRLANATDFLMLPQYFSYKLTGVKSHEYTEESTGGYLNAKTKKYDMDILNTLGFPSYLFKDIKMPGYVLGKLSDEVSKIVGGNTNVILCASHDTGSAFEAVDSPKDAIIISSGTWSLIGVKADKPNTSLNSYECNFTNEGGVGYIRYLKNIMGMWIVNEICRQKNLNVVDICKKLDDISYHEIFDVNHETLQAPKVMEDAVRNLLKKNPPKNDLELFASIYHSLAYSYNVACEQLERNTGVKYRYIYIVGGGAKNVYLNKLVEKYTNKKVVALPIEATALGNIKIQMKVAEVH